MADVNVPNPQTGSKQHVHHAYIWLDGLRGFFWAIVVVAIGAVSSVGSILDEDPALAFALRSHIALALAGLAILVLLIAGLIFGIKALAYKNLWYELTPSELGVYSGIISKKRTHVPYQKIQSVDLKATLVQRIFGLCTVVIDTAGGAANKAVLIPYLQKGPAEALRNQLYALKSASIAADPASADAVMQAQLAPSASQAAAASAGPQFAPPAGAPVYVGTAAPEGNVFDMGDQAWREFGGVFASQPVQDQAPSYEYGLTNKEIFLTGISNSSGVLAGIIGALAAGAVTLIPILSSIAVNASEAAGIDGETLSSFMGSAIAVIAPIAIIALIVFALFIWAIASLAACLQFGGFKARRRGSRIEVERGLLQHNAISLDIERVQSVIIKQSFIRRIAGYCEVSLGKVNAMEGTGSNNDANAKALAEAGFIIHPFVKLDKVEGILHGMVPEYADLPKDESRVAPVALRRGLIRRCMLFGGGFWLALITLIAQAIVHAVAGSGAVSASEALEVLGIVDIISTILYVLAAIVLAFEIAGALLWYRDSRFATDRRMIALTNGGLSKTTIALPKTKVQFGSTKTNPLQRRARTATICATTAAGIGGTATTLIDVSADVADAWMQWLEPTGRVAQEQA